MYPEFKLIEPPDGASQDVIKDIVQTNLSILDYISKIDSRAEEIDAAALEREKSIIELEKARIDLDRARSYANRDIDGFRHRTGIFTLYDDVSDFSVKQVINDLSLWHSNTAEGIGFQLNISSYGGSVTDGFALFDTIRNVAEEGKRSVKTVSLGITASMGGVLLQAGDERVMTPSSVMLIHEISYGSGGSRAEHEDRKVLAEILTNRVADIFCSRSGMAVEKFEEMWNRRDWWMSADDTLKYGFADRVAYK